MSKQIIEQISDKFNKLLENEPFKDLEQNVRAVIASVLTKLDLVSRQEFDVQAQVLATTREKLERLEKLVAQLEAEKLAVKNTCEKKQQ